AITRDSWRVVHSLPGHETFGASIGYCDARDWLIEHVRAATESAVVSLKVNRFAVGRPDIFVHPRIVHHKRVRRAATSGHNRQTARSHDVGLALSRSERQPLTVGRESRSVVDSLTIHDCA